jgi:hypothetical protein
MANFASWILATKEVVLCWFYNVILYLVARWFSSPTTESDGAADEFNISKGSGFVEGDYKFVIQFCNNE